MFVRSLRFVSEALYNVNNTFIAKMLQSIASVGSSLAERTDKGDS
jgi:hypothetical protein